MNIASKFFANKTLAFPYIQINGSVTRETYLLFIIECYFCGEYVTAPALRYEEAGNRNKFRLRITFSSTYNKPKDQRYFPTQGNLALCVHIRLCRECRVLIGLERTQNIC